MMRKASLQEGDDSIRDVSSATLVQRNSTPPLPAATEKVSTAKHAISNLGLMRAQKSMRIRASSSQQMERGVLVVEVLSTRLRNSLSRTKSITSNASPARGATDMLTLSWSVWLQTKIYTVVSASRLSAHQTDPRSSRTQPSSWAQGTRTSRTPALAVEEKCLKQRK